ncbi:hypothetical protein M9H77_02014 [Catharanthus roseus]|uniref:Uncharacterized protein n=1 Tax=Catharanthus roseus TaxID=4058 RepID=A0ACC0C7H0_CATRO|nr:hypothetical protein M9H77_02014 [Catharanthus roseus]
MLKVGLLKATMIVFCISLCAAVSSPLLLFFFLLSTFLAVDIRLELLFYLSSSRLPPPLSSACRPSVMSSLPSAFVDRLVVRSFAWWLRSYHHLPFCSTRDRPFTVSVVEEGIYICNRIVCKGSIS